MADLTAAEALRRHEAELRRLPEVAGLGLGEDATGKEVLVIFVRQGVDPDAMRARVPAQLDGYQTELRPEIRVFPGQQPEGETDE